MVIIISDNNSSSGPNWKMNDSTKHNSPHGKVSEKHFRGMIESTAGIPWIMDSTTFQFIYVGPQAEKILGFPVEQWYKTDFWREHVHPDDRQAVFGYCEEAIQNGKDYNFECRMIHCDGHSVWILAYVNIVIEGGAPIQLQGFMFDISKDKQTEQTLQEHTALLDAIYRASPDMIFIHDDEGHILDVNNNAAQRYNYRMEEMRRLSIADVSANPDNLPLVGACMQRVLGGAELDFEWLAKDSDSKPFPVEIRLRKLEGRRAPGAPAVIATIRDITERKHTEESIKNIAAGVSAGSGDTFYQQMVKHLAKLFDVDYAFIGLLNADNPEIINTLSIFSHGSTAENISYSLVNTPCATIVGQSTCCHLSEVQQQYPNDPRLVDLGVNSIIGTPLFDSNNHPIGLIELLDSKPMKLQQQRTEILEIFAARAAAEIERDKIHQRLKNTQQKLALHVQQTPLGVIEWDTRFCITDWNPAAENIFGYNKTEALGKNVRELLTLPQHHQTSDDIGRNLLETRNITLANLTQDQLTITCEWYNTSLATDDGEAIGIASLVANITDRVQAETALKEHRDRLEELVEQRTVELQKTNQELESFSFSVSHDLRTPLRHISGFSQILLEDYAEQLNAEGQTHLRHIHDRTQHMEQLISDLLELSRAGRGAFEREPLLLSEMVREIIGKLQYYSPERVITVDITPQITVAADYHLTQIMLDNLIGNAWKYSSKVPHATLEFGEIYKDGKPVYFLRDNGAGFNMKHADKLFTPFKRLHTESQFEGTGIGLATVQRIINRHAGRIWAEAEKGKGAAFYFTLND